LSIVKRLRRATCPGCYFGTIVRSNGKKDHGDFVLIYKKAHIPITKAS
jgi:hypothetical protein